MCACNTHTQRKQTRAHIHTEREKHVQREKKQTRAERERDRKTSTCKVNTGPVPKETHLPTPYPRLKASHTLPQGPCPTLSRVLWRIQGWRHVLPLVALGPVLLDITSHHWTHLLHLWRPPLQQNLHPHLPQPESPRGGELRGHNTKTKEFVGWSGGRPRIRRALPDSWPGLGGLASNPGARFLRY